MVICLRIVQNNVDGHAPAWRTTRKNISHYKCWYCNGSPWCVGLSPFVMCACFLRALSKITGSLLKNKIKNGTRTGNVLLNTCIIWTTWQKRKFSKSLKRHWEKPSQKCKARFHCQLNYKQTTPPNDWHQQNSMRYVLARITLVAIVAGLVSDAH